MRIVAGKFKGRRLTGPKGDSARPTSDKVREALFSMLGPVENFAVLDLFAGTGAVGIESLSRGAAHATFVEINKQMRAVVQSNLQVVAGDEQELFTVVSGDAIDHLSRAAAAGTTYDFVFVDPPYADAEKLSPKLAELIPQVLADGATVVAECDRRSPLMLEISAQDGLQAGLSLVTERKYGDTLIRILRSPSTRE